MSFESVNVFSVLFSYPLFYLFTWYEILITKYKNKLTNEGKCQFFYVSQWIFFPVNVTHKSVLTWIKRPLI